MDAIKIRFFRYQPNKMKKAFTLIEILIVISIIGILAALITVSFTASQRQARDTQRKSDLAQYRTAVETFASKGDGLYPLYASSIGASDTLCTALELSSCPTDPTSSQSYSYCSNDTGTNYVLWATLEGVDSNWTVCSNGRSAASTNDPTCGASFDCKLPP